MCVCVCYVSICYISNQTRDSDDARYHLTFIVKVSSWHLVLTFIFFVCVCVHACACVCVYVCVPNVPRRIVKPDIFDIVGTGHFK